MSDGFVAGFAARHDLPRRARRRRSRPLPGSSDRLRGPTPCPARIEAPTAAAGTPTHFSPADPRRNPTAGWDPLDPRRERERLRRSARRRARRRLCRRACRRAQPSTQATPTRDRALLAGLADALVAGRRIDRDRVARAAAPDRAAPGHAARRRGRASRPTCSPPASRPRPICLADAAESAMLRVHPDDVALLEGACPPPSSRSATPRVARGSFVLESASTIVEDGPELWLDQLAAAIDRVPAPQMLNRFTSPTISTPSQIRDFAPRPQVSGRLASFDGLLMEAVGLTLPVGTVCQVGDGATGVEAEVIGFRNGRTLMMNLGGPAALLPGAPVRPIGPPGEAEVGAAHARPRRRWRRQADRRARPDPRRRHAGRSPASSSRRSIVAACSSRSTSACARSTGC